jgi:hypothetical protein
MSTKSGRTIFKNILNETRSVSLMSTSLGPYIYLAYLTRFIEIRNEQFNIFDSLSMIGVQ